jgi:glycosyltransferase involved in cell wall biosynthesis
VKNKICFLASEPSSMDIFWRDQIKICKNLFDVHLICNNQYINPLKYLRVILKMTKIKRKPNLFNDIKLFFVFFFYFKKKRFLITHSITPKVGFITSLASYLNRIPIRIHTFTGQVWITKKGFLRWTLILFDKIIFFLSTHIIIDSISQKRFLIKNKIIKKKKNKIYVFGNGSISGVNIKKFYFFNKKNILRKKYNINQDYKIILYVGRINIDKGLFDLVKSFNYIKRDFPKTSLIFVGPEDGLSIEKIKNLVKDDFKKDFYYFHFTKNPEEFMNLADVLCLPSYREGFGQVVIEAAACKLPAVVSNIYGLKDSVKNNFSGFSFKSGNIKDLSRKLKQILNDYHLRYKMSVQAQTRAVNQFSSTIIKKDVKNFYKDILNCSKNNN